MSFLRLKEQGACDLQASSPGKSISPLWSVPQWGHVCVDEDAPADKVQMPTQI
jgi:hypothetical protein